MRKISIILVVLVLAGAAAWFGRPAYRSHKEKRFASQAREALRANEPRKALLSAQQALVLNSNNVVACQVMADLSDGTRSPQAIYWRRRIAELAPTTENRIMLAACALRYEPAPFPTTTQTLDSLPPDARDTVPFYSVAAQLALKQNRGTDAEKQLERAIQLEPTNVLHRINLAVVQLESKDSATAAKGKAELEKWQNDPDWSRNVLRSLVIHHFKSQQFADAEHYSTALLQGTNTLFSDILQHLAILSAARSPSLEGFLRQAERDASTNAVMASDLVVRMTAMNRAGDAVAWAKGLPAEVQNQLPLPVAMAEALMAMKAWREMEAFLTKQQWQERDFLRQALLSYAVRQQNAGEVSSVHWREAIQLAAERPELMLFLGQLSSSWGWTNETESLLWRAVKDFPREHWPVDSLQGSYMRMGNTRGLYEINSLLLERDSTNLVTQNNWATLALLLQTNTAKAHQLAREIYNRDTKNVGYVSTYAWSLHVQGKNVEALKLMETLPSAALEDPSLASYYGAILAETGQKEKAQQYLAKAETGNLLPEEKQLVIKAKKAIQ